MTYQQFKCNPWNKLKYQKNVVLQEQQKKQQQHAKNETDQKMKHSHEINQKTKVKLLLNIYFNWSNSHHFAVQGYRLSWFA